MRKTVGSWQWKVRGNRSILKTTEDLRYSPPPAPVFASKTGAGGGERKIHHEMLEKS